jgi:hypothetical protein
MVGAPDFREFRRCCISSETFRWFARETLFELLELGNQARAGPA